MLGPGTTLRERARVSRSVIDASCYIGRSVTIEGAILGRNCDVRPHARVHEGVAVGDQVTLGDQSVIFPGVRIYPYKEVEYGAQIHESLIWESRGTTKVFAQDGVVGLVNVDLTPEVALRVGAALGTALKRGARVVASRESAPAYRMIKRALISGLNSTGVQVADLRTLPAPVGKHLLKTQNYDAAFHVGASTTDPEAVQIRLFERPGVALSDGDAEGDREALHATGAAAGAVRRRRLDHLPGPGARELRERPARRPRRRRRSASAASGSSSTTATRAAASSCRSSSGRSASRRSRRTRSSPTPARRRRGSARRSTTRSGSSRR